MRLPVFTPEPRARKRVLEIGAIVLALSCVGPVSLLVAQTSHASPPAAPAASPSGKSSAAATPTPTATIKPLSKEIPIPLPIGDKALGLKVPNIGAAGQLLSQLLAAKATRIDENHLELQGTKIDLNQADGKSDYHIEIPTSIFDLKTRDHLQRSRGRDPDAGF